MMPMPAADAANVAQATRREQRERAPHCRWMPTSSPTRAHEQTLEPCRARKIAHVSRCHSSAPTAPITSAQTANCVAKPRGAATDPPLVLSRQSDAAAMIGKPRPDQQLDGMLPLGAQNEIGPHALMLGESSRREEAQ